MSTLKVITRAEVCREFNCHRDSLKRWIKEKGFPSPLPCPAREPIFDIEEVNRWIRGDKTLENRGGRHE